MTRENKLALVIGFGLILFVGVLVSDHFSAARTLKEADLSSDAGFVQVMNQPALRLVDLSPPEPEPAREELIAETPVAWPQPMEFADVFVPVGQAREPIDGGQVVRLPDLQQLAAAAEEVRIASNGRIIFHLVQKGETLSSISRRYYGDASHANHIASLNDMNDPNALHLGHRIRVAVEPEQVEPAAIPGFVPVESEPSPIAMADSRPQARRETPVQKARTYTIKSSDTLSEISQRTLGTSKRWRELVAMNPDVITDPDRIPAGAVIKIPGSQAPAGRLRQ